MLVKRDFLCDCSIRLMSMWFDRKRFLLLCLVIINVNSVMGSYINGRHLKVVAAELEMTFEISESPSRSFGGVTYELLLWLSTRLNFTFEMHILEEFDFGVEVNGSYTGFLGILQRKEADLALSAFGYEEAGKYVADPSFMWGVIDFSVQIPFPEEESKTWAAIKPFQPQLWTCIFITFVVMTLSIQVFKKLQIKLKLNRNQHLSESASIEVMYLIGVVTGQGGYLGQKGKTAVYLGAVWCLAAFILVSAYSSLLMSFLSTTKLVPLVDSLRELSEKVDRVPLFTFKGTSPDTEIMNAEDGFLKVLRNYLEQHPESRKQLETTCSNEALLNKGVCITATRSIEIFVEKNLRENHGCELSRAKDVFYPILVFLLFQRHSPYTKELNHQIAWANDFGLTAKWFKDQLKYPFKCLERQPSQPRNASLTLRDLSSAFVILGIGISLSVIAVVAEVLVAFVKKPRK